MFFLLFISCFSLTHTTSHHIYFLIKFTSRTIENPPKKTTIENPPKIATKTTIQYKTPEKAITTAAAKSTSTKHFNMTKSPEVQVFTITKEQLLTPENIDCHSVLFYLEYGHSITGGTKKMDKFCVQIPIQDPNDYHSGRIGVAMNKESQILGKVPKHPAAASNSKELCEEDYTIVIADGHRELATRTKEHQRDGRNDELIKIFALDLPFKATTQYNKIASKAYCTIPWAGEDTCLVDHKFSVIWKELSKGTRMPVMFVTYSVGIENSIRDVELADDNDVIDTLAELSIAAKKEKRNAYGMSH